MPLTIDIINSNKVLRRWIDTGFKQGEAALLRRLIERKFGELPPWAAAKLEAAKPKTIEKWSLRILDAKTLEQVLR